LQSLPVGLQSLDRFQRLGFGKSLVGQLCLEIAIRDLGLFQRSLGSFLRGCLRPDHLTCRFELIGTDVTIVVVVATDHGDRHLAIMHKTPPGRMRSVGHWRRMMDVRCRCIASQSKGTPHLHFR
jgi:hypothetical protein